MGISSPIFRNGFRLVVFSVIIMIFVLFFRNGIMGDREFSSVGMYRAIKNLPGKIAGKFKKSKAEVRE